MTTVIDADTLMQNPEALPRLWEVMCDERDFWFSTWDALDAKAGILIGALMAFAALVIGVGQQPRVLTAPTDEFVLLISLVLGVAVGAALALAAISIQRAKWPPGFRWTARRCIMATEARVTAEAISDYRNFRQEVIQRACDRKAVLVQLAYNSTIFSFVVGIGVLYHCGAPWFYVVTGLIASLSLGFRWYWKEVRRRWR